MKLKIAAAIQLIRDTGVFVSEEEVSHESTDAALPLNDHPYVRVDEDVMDTAAGIAGFILERIGDDLQRLAQRALHQRGRKDQMCVHVVYAKDDDTKLWFAHRSAPSSYSEEENNSGWDDEDVANELLRRLRVEGTEVQPAQRPEQTEKELTSNTTGASRCQRCRPCTTSGEELPPPLEPADDERDGGFPPSDMGCMQLVVHALQREVENLREKVEALTLGAATQLRSEKGLSDAVTGLRESMLETASIADSVEWCGEEAPDGCAATGKHDTQPIPDAPLIRSLCGYLTETAKRVAVLEIAIRHPHLKIDRGTGMVTAVDGIPVFVVIDPNGTIRTLADEDTKDPIPIDKYARHFLVTTMMKMVKLHTPRLPVLQHQYLNAMVESITKIEFNCQVEADMCKLITTCFVRAMPYRYRGRHCAWADQNQRKKLPCKSGRDFLDAVEYAKRNLATSALLWIEVSDGCVTIMSA